MRSYPNSPFSNNRWVIRLEEPRTSLFSRRPQWAGSIPTARDLGFAEFKRVGRMLRSGRLRFGPPGFRRIPPFRPRTIVAGYRPPFERTHGRKPIRARGSRRTARRSSSRAGPSGSSDGSSDPPPPPDNCAHRFANRSATELRTILYAEAQL